MSNPIVVIESTDVIVNPTMTQLSVCPVDRSLVLLPNKCEITLEGATTNFAVVGEATVEYQNTAITALNAFDLVVDTPTGFELADANNPAHFTYAAGFVLETVLAGQTVAALVDGKIENTTWTFTVGDPLFMNTVPGTITTIPDPSGEFFRQIGWVLEPDLILVQQFQGTLNL